MLVVIESPWAGLGAGEKAQGYLVACIRDSLSRGEIPWASHAMFAWTRALYEEDDEQRAEGLEVNKRMIIRCDKVAFYVDYENKFRETRGFSPGMLMAWNWAAMHGKKRELRYIYR